jgi:hypothetical protein
MLNAEAQWIRGEKFWRIVFDSSLPLRISAFILLRLPLGVLGVLAVNPISAWSRS